MNIAPSDDLNFEKECIELVQKNGKLNNCMCVEKVSIICGDVCSRSSGHFYIIWAMP